MIEVTKYIYLELEVLNKVYCVPLFIVISRDRSDDTEVSMLISRQVV